MMVLNLGTMMGLIAGPEVKMSLDPILVMIGLLV
jgi:hypothetical protein